MADSINRLIWVDVTSAVGVESVLAMDGPIDPWGSILMGRFADVFVKANSVSFPLPTPDDNAIDPHDARIPQLFRRLSELDKSRISLHPVRLPDLPIPDGMDLAGEANRLVTWINDHSASGEPNKRHVLQWMTFQRAVVEKIGRLRGVKETGMRGVEIADRIGDEVVADLANSVGMIPADFLYVFDNVVRTANYLAVSKNNGCFLLHNLRRASKIGLSADVAQNNDALEDAFGGWSIAGVFSEMRPKISEYCIILSRMRNSPYRDALMSADSDEQRRTLEELLRQQHVPQRNVIIDVVLKEGLVPSVIADFMISAATGQLAVFLSYLSMTSYGIQAVKDQLRKVMLSRGLATDDRFATTFRNVVRAVDRKVVYDWKASRLTNLVGSKGYYPIKRDDLR